MLLTIFIIIFYFGVAESQDQPGLRNGKCSRSWEKCGEGLTLDECVDKKCCYVTGDCMKIPKQELDDDYDDEDEDDPYTSVPVKVKYQIRKLRQVDKTSIEEIQEYLKKRVLNCTSERCTMERKGAFTSIMKTTNAGVMKPVQFKSGVDISIIPSNKTHRATKAIFIEYPTLTEIIRRNKEKTQANYKNSKCSETEIFLDELPVISINLYNNKWKKISMPVNFSMSKFNSTIPEDKNKETRVSCRYLNETNYIWSETGCNVIPDMNSRMSCYCSHTTKFSILFVVSPLNLNFTEQEMNNIKTLEYVMQSLSVFCLLTTFGILILVQKRRTKSMTSGRASERTAVHCNFVVALACLHIVRLGSDIAVDISQLHYFMLASGTWMLMEGVLLYITVILQSLNSVKLGIYKFILGWGIPAIIVALAAGIAVSRGSYVQASLDDDIICKGVIGTKVGKSVYEHCWLSVDEGVIWAATGPLILIFTINIFILAHTVLFVLLLSRRTDTMRPANCPSNNHKHFWHTAKGILILFPILGVPWLIGFLANIQVATTNLIFQYVHVIFNGLQGVFIFVLYCIVSKEARSTIYRLLNTRWEQHKVSVSASNTLGKSNNSFNSLRRSRKRSVGSQQGDMGKKITSYNTRASAGSNVSQYSTYTPTGNRKQSSVTSASTISGSRMWSQMNSLDRIHTRAQYSALMHPGSSVSLPRSWIRNGGTSPQDGSMSSLIAQAPLSRMPSALHRICKECGPYAKNCPHGYQQVAGFHKEFQDNVVLTGYESLDKADYEIYETSTLGRRIRKMTAEEFKRFSAIPEEKRRSGVVSMTFTEGQEDNNESKNGISRPSNSKKISVTEAIVESAEDSIHDGGSNASLEKADSGIGESESQSTHELNEESVDITNSNKKMAVSYSKNGTKAKGHGLKREVSTGSVLQKIEAIEGKISNKVTVK